MQGCRPLTEEVYSVEKVVEKGIVLELATTSRKYPKTLRPMEALGQDLATHVSPLFLQDAEHVAHRLGVQQWETELGLVLGTFECFQAACRL